jgi:hypothetical protein
MSFARQMSEGREHSEEEEEQRFETRACREKKTHNAPLKIKSV